VAIDAVIVNVKDDKANGDLLLILGPRIYKDAAGKWGSSNPGQPVLRVRNATYRPIVGQHIWGGADTARTVDNIPGAKKQEYKRTFAGYLIEA
jgi:hypothetical protein